MNCEHARALLPESVYVELPVAQRDELKQHVSQCPACAEAWRGLHGVRQMLDSLPPPAVEVDLPLLYQEARALDDRRLRRWRRVAWASAAAAGVLLTVTILRVEVRWDQRELAFGWGAARPVPPVLKLPEESPLPTTVLADLQLVKDLIHSIVADMDERQQEHAAALANLEQRLESIQSMSNRRSLATQNDFRALYTACFGVAEKGAIP